MKFLSRVLLLAFAIPFAAVAQKHGEKRPLAPIPADVTFAPAKPALPTVFIVGDSTGHGWGPEVLPYFDPAKINVVVAAASGRSSRTYINEGIWARVLKQVRPRDIVLVQFGHNDRFSINDADRARGSIKGIGDETQAIENQMTHQHEVVLSFGGYLRQYIHDAQAKGATPIVLSLTPRNAWVSGKMTPDPDGYGVWAGTVAKQEHVGFVDANTILAEHFQAMGQEKAEALFHDDVHLKPENWTLDAQWIVSGLKALPGDPMAGYLSAAGRAIPAAVAK